MGAPASARRPGRVLLFGTVLVVDQVRKVTAPGTVLSPVKITTKAANAAASEAVIKALVVTDLAYCVLLREPVWRVSGIRLP